jgi:purine-nucleoside phosphorylase
MVNGQQQYFHKIEEAVTSIQARLDGFVPAFACILGSGLGDLAERVEHKTVIAYHEIPHFPQSTVAGHAGQLVFGVLAGVPVVMMQGRFHLYEGYTMKEVALPVYVMHRLGAKQLLVTNAAGGMNPDFRAGDLMLIGDHLNMTGDNPLIGPNDERLGVRFPDMSSAYDRDHRAVLKQLAEECFAGESITLREGVYAGISGPSYMTPAELIMLARCGGDAIGMSTVAEVIAARHAGMRVLGISCITDMAVGEHLEPLTHEQVVAVANRTKPLFAKLIVRFFQHLRG